MALVIIEVAQLLTGVNLLSFRSFPCGWVFLCHLEEIIDDYSFEPYVLRRRSANESNALLTVREHHKLTSQSS